MKTALGIARFNCPKTTEQAIPKFTLDTVSGVHLSLTDIDGHDG